MITIAAILVAAAGGLAFGWAFVAGAGVLNRAHSAEADEEECRHWQEWVRQQELKKKFPNNGAFR
jgi:hypothetical protein